MKKITVPKNLSQAAKKLWQKIQGEYQITDSGGLSILTTTLEAWDRMKQCEQTLENEGLTVIDRFGQQKTHPLCTVERDSRSQFLQGLKALNLDLEPLRDGPGRPEGS
jgi:P27 family predicted phage terminase small subunit